MKEYVVDANILFSALISGKPFYKTLFVRNTFYTPNFVFSEIEAYEDVLLEKIKVGEEAFKQLTLFLFSNLHVIPEFVLTVDSVKKAHHLCKDVDPKDTTYIALAIELNISFVTRDKPLYSHLMAQGFTQVVMFNTLVENQKS